MGGGREAPEGGDICVHVADSLHCTQKLTHFKAIILQLKNIKIKTRQKYKGLAFPLKKKKDQEKSPLFTMLTNEQLVKIPKVVTERLKVLGGWETGLHGSAVLRLYVCVSHSVVSSSL